MVGSAIFKALKKNQYENVIIANKKQLNLLDQKKTTNFLKNQKIDIVIIAAAKVGGIQANNKFRADFLYENLQIQNNLIHGGYLAGIKRLIFLGSSCIYPRNCPQPIKEDYLLGGPLEFTNEPYAIAKIAGLKLCENYNKQYKTNYLSLMPCNLFGENDNYDLFSSHFLPSIIRKTHEAKIKNIKKINLWGNGKAKRELMHVDDLADACIFFLNKRVKESFINIGSGIEFRISEYVNKVFEILNYKGKAIYDKKMPNGTPQKILDCSKAKQYGWYPKIKFEDGLKKTYKSFLNEMKY